MPGVIVDYILKSANTWNGPIKDFTLRLKLDSPGEFVSLCFPGRFRRTNMSTFESHIVNFPPDRDMKVAFLNVPESEASHFPPRVPPAFQAR